MRYDNELVLNTSIGPRKLIIYASTYESMYDSDPLPENALDGNNYRGRELEHAECGSIRGCDLAGNINPKA